MNRLNGDLLMYVVSYLDSIDVGLVSPVCRRWLWVLDKLTNYQPSLAVKSSTEFNTKETVREALHSMSGVPNVAFAFWSNQQGIDDSADWLNEMKSQLPKDCKVLAAQSYNVQVNLNSKVSSNAKFSLSLGSFPEAKAISFSMPMTDFAMNDTETTVANILRDWEMHIPPQAPDYYTTFVLYSCGNASGVMTEPLIKAIQEKYPKAAIIGGICSATAAKSDASDPVASILKAQGGLGESVEGMSIKELKATIRSSKGERFNFSGMEKVELVDLAKEIREKSLDHLADIELVSDGVCGMAIGGNCPLRSVVSRGMRSVTTNKIALAGDNDPRTTIGEVQEHSEDVDFDEGYRKVHTLIKPPKKDEEEGEEENNPINWVMEPFHRGKRPQYIGIRTDKESGFLLHPLSQNVLDTSDGSLILESSVEVASGAELDLFALDGPSCIADLESTLSTLKSQLDGEELLSALMFSCGGRGPEKNQMFQQDMLDAAYFEKVFPSIPLLGFYAGGEIGPEARVAREDAFMSANAAIQGFTAVFGVFIVPKRILSDFTMNLTAEDTEEAWAKHSQFVLAAKTKAV